jgi:HNH endonuclease
MASEDIPQNHPIVTRAEAKAAGLKFYFTGKECSRGHVAQRRVGNYQCSQCEPVNQREWRIKNPEKAQAAFDKWRKNNPEKYKAALRKHAESEKSKIYHREWAANHRQEQVAATRAWQRRNPEKVRAAWRKRHKNNPERYNTAANEWRKNNPEKVRIQKRKQYRRQYDNNPEIFKAAAHRRRALKKKAGGKFTAADIKRILKQQKGKCAYYGICRHQIPPYHVDHIVPLIAGGSNAPSNIQLLCASCNCKKHDLDQIEFMQRNGKLL